MYDPVKARWDVLTPPQRYKLLGVIAVVILAIIFTLWLAFRTQWETIVSGSNSQEINPMRVVLDQAGIPNRVRSHNSVLQVDARREADATAVIHAEGRVPNSEHFTWANALDTSLSTTDEERRLLAVRGAEGAIERQLVVMNGIAEAYVTLAIPNARPFERNAPMPSASVVITTNNSFSSGQGRILANLVSNHVSRLTPDNVSIVDQWMNPIWDGSEVTTDPHDTVMQMRNMHTNHVVMSLRDLLSSTFGTVNVMYNPRFDPRISEESVNKIVSTPAGMDTGIPLLNTGANRSFEGGGGGLEPGLANNQAAFPNYAMAGQGILSAQEREWTRHYAINEYVTTTSFAFEAIMPEYSTLAISVVQDLVVERDFWLSQEGREDYTIDDWERFKHRYQSPQVLGDFADFENFRDLIATATGLPLANVSFVVSQRLIPIDPEGRDWDIPTILMVAVLLLLLAMLLFGLLRKQRAAGENEEALEPQLAVEDLLVSTQLEEAREEAAAELEEIDYFKENEIKKHIEKFVNEKPEAVAALLRNWINVEEW